MLLLSVFFDKLENGCSQVDFNRIKDNVLPSDETKLVLAVSFAAFKWSL